MVRGSGNTLSYADSESGRKESSAESFLKMQFVTSKRKAEYKLQVGPMCINNFVTYAPWHPILYLKMNQIGLRYAGKNCREASNFALETIPSTV